MPASVVERHHGEHLISTDPARVDVIEVDRYLSNESYWAAGRALDGDQIGFGRMVTDLATYAWLADVHVLPPARNSGLGVEMVRTIVERQVESLGEILGGLALGELAQATSITVALTCSSALVACAGLLVMRSRAGRAPVASADRVPVADG